MAEAADARTSHPGTAVRAFLIADIRGYTRFTEQHGDVAAARLAARFAAVTHEVVEARDGDLIELRGDEALVVFASTRQAVRAALEAQRAYAEEMERDPALPLRVGIGLDVGEAVPVAGGYRGAALNRAARLCAQAGPGEVLASESVLHLGGRIEGVRAAERSVDALKGLEEPVRVVRLLAETQPGVASGTTAAVPAPREPVAGDMATTPTTDAALLERDPDLRWLRGWWRIARRGRASVLVVTGVPGSGRSSLARAIAAEATADGALVQVVNETATPAEAPALATDLLRVATAGGPTLLVLDDLERLPRPLVELPERLMDAAPRAPALVVAVADAAALDPSRGPLRPLLARLAAADLPAPRHLAPLGRESVRRIAGGYAPADAPDPPVDAIADASGGLPALVHRLAAEWARTAAVQRLRVSTSRAAEGRRELRALEDTVAAQVVDLQLVRERAGLLTAPDPGAVVCPFKGLASFETDDAPYFYGRERLIADLVARLVGATFLGVVGPSGSGKSSVVRAGLVPALRSGVLPGSEGWGVHVLRPGEAPLRTLIDVLGGSAHERYAAAGATDSAGEERAAQHAIERALAGSPGGARRVLVVDQFEELFTAARDDTERTSFLRLLTAAAARPDRRLLVVAVLRADLYDRVAIDPRLAELMAANHVLLGPMRPDELRRAIELPARRAGLRVEPALVEALVEEVEGEPGALPLLSTALLELWQRRDGRALTLERYRETGGVRGAVARLAEDAFARLAPGEAERARGVMMRLVRVEEDGAVVRRRAALREFDLAGDAAAARVLEVFTAGRLLTAGEGRVEVAHEALLREWPRLRTWLDEDAEGRQLLRHLAEAAQEWVTGGRDPGELYRGARLSAATDWAAAHGGDLNALEREFLAESRAAADREAERARRTNRRLRTLLGAAVVLLAVSLGAGGLAVGQAREAERERAAAEAQRALAERERTEAERQRTEAETQRAEAERQRSEADRQRAQAERAATVATAQRLSAQALADTQLDRALLLAAASHAIADSSEARGALLTTLLESAQALRVHRYTGARILAVAISPDGTQLAYAERTGNLLLVDTLHGETRLLLDEGSNQYIELAFAPDGEHLAVLDLDSVRWFRLVEGAIAGEVVLTAPETPWDMAIAPDGTRAAALISADEASFRVVQWDVRSGATEVGVERFKDAGRAVYTADGARILVSTPAELVALDARDLSVVRRYPTSGAAVVAASPTDPIVALSANGLGLDFLDLASGSVTRGARVHTQAIQALTFTPDGRRVISAGDDAQVIVWDVASAAPVATLRGHGGRVLGVSATREVVYTGGLDGSVIAWDLTGTRGFGRSFRLEGPVNAVGTVAVADDGTAAFLTARGIGIVDTDEARLVRTVGEVGLSASAVAISPDAREVAAATRHGPRRWDTATGHELPRLDHAGPVLAVGYSRAGAFAATTEDLDLRVWSREGRSRHTVPLRSHGTTLAFSADGRLITVGTDAGTVYIVDAEGGSIVGELFTEDAVYAAAFSPDGSSLAAGGPDGIVRFYGVDSGSLEGQAIQSMAGYIHSVSWSADGKTVATAGTDGTVRLVDRETGLEVASSFPVALNQDTAAAFLPQGRSLVYVQSTGIGHVFPASIDRWVAIACQVAGRHLTEDERERYFGSLEAGSHSCGDPG